MLQALFEGFANGLLIPLSSESLFFATKSFGAEQAQLLALAAAGLAGFALAQGAHWGIGRALVQLHAKGKMLTAAQYALAATWFRYALPLLVFSWWGMAGMLVIAAGFFRVPLWLVLALAAVGKALYYAYYLI